MSILTNEEKQAVWDSCRGDKELFVEIIEATEAAVLELAAKARQLLRRRP